MHCRRWRGLRLGTRLAVSRTPCRRSIRRRAMASVGAALLTMASGCGDDEDADARDDPVEVPGDAQPSPGAAAFTEGYFDSLPLPGLAQPVGRRTETANAMVRS